MEDVPLLHQRAVRAAQRRSVLAVEGGHGAERRRQHAVRVAAQGRHLRRQRRAGRLQDAHPVEVRGRADGDVARVAPRPFRIDLLVL